MKTFTKYTLYSNGTPVANIQAENILAASIYAGVHWPELQGTKQSLTDGKDKGDDTAFAIIKGDLQVHYIRGDKEDVSKEVIRVAKEGYVLVASKHFSVFSYAPWPEMYAELYDMMQPVI